MNLIFRRNCNLKFGFDSQLWILDDFNDDTLDTPLKLFDEDIKTPNF